MQARTAEHEEEEELPLSDDEYLPLSEADSFDAERDQQDAYLAEWEWEQAAHKEIAAAAAKVQVHTSRENVLLAGVSTWASL